MKREESFDVTGGSGIVGIFKNESYKLERVISEFIDNSLQSYLDHRDVLSRLPGGKCVVNIYWIDDQIIIDDNAFGMDQEELGRALKPRSKNPRANEKNRLSIFGMGVNYATAYLCACYTIETSQYGSTEKRRVTVDIDELEAENPESVKGSVVDEEKYEHYTKITFNRLRVKLTDKSADNLMMKLGLIFKGYIQEGSLIVNFNGVPVNFEYPPIRLDDQGDKYLRNFSDTFSANGKLYEYTGWIAVLKKGNQSITGFNLMQAQRCIEVGYSPKTLFGSGNSFQNSRIIGEIYLEGIELSFTKDKFVWQSNGVEEAFIESLDKNADISFILKICEELRREESGEKITKKMVSGAKKLGTTVVAPSTSTTKPKPKTEKPDQPSSTTISEPAPSAETVKAKPAAGTDEGGNGDTSSPLTIPNPVVKQPVADELGKPEKQFESKDELPRIVVEIDGKEVTIIVDSYAGSYDGDWISLVPVEENVWKARFNYKNEFITLNFPKENGKAGANLLGVALITALLRSKSRGLKLTDSNTLIQQLNKVMGSKNA